MRVAVLGAGAIGAYVGAALQRGGQAEVHLVARGRHLEAMRRDGVRVSSERGDMHEHPHATGDTREIGQVDYVVLGLKAHDYAGAGPMLAPLLGPGTVLVAAQNGIPWWYFHGVGGAFEGRRVEAVDPGGAVSAIMKPERALGCVVYSSAELEVPGVVRHLEGTRFTLGEPDGSDSERARAFSEAMVAGGLKAPVVRNIRDELWVKLMGNVAFNPLSALTRATMVEICRDREARGLVVAVMEEALAVARNLGAAPEVSIERRLAGAERVGEHKTSMLQDLESGKQLELAAIVGAVVELAELTSTQAPALRAVHAATGLLARTVAKRAGVVA